ncbi:hypothetical protein H5410_059792, partial [Solanum commersonii]
SAEICRGFDPFWDYTSNVFCFAILSCAYIGGVGWFHKNKCTSSILHKECLDNGLVSLEFTYSRYGKKEGFSNYGKTTLKWATPHYLGKA